MWLSFLGLSLSLSVCVCIPPQNVHGADFPRANGSLRVLGCQVGEENYKKKKNGFFIVTENRE